MVEVKDVIKRSNQGETLDIIYDAEKGRLTFKFSGLGPERKFSITTLDIEGEDISIPTLSPTAKIRLKSSILEEAVKDMEVVSNHMRFHADADILKVTTASDTREVDVEIKKEDESVSDFDVSEEAKAGFTLGYLKDMTKAVRLADDVTILPKKGHPISGKETYLELNSQRQESDTKSQLKWKPYFVDISASADLGYTLGRYESTVTDAVGNKQVTYGYYVTIWKKQPDGSWKFVFDTGNESPSPEEKEAN